MQIRIVLQYFLNVNLGFILQTHALDECVIHVEFSLLYDNKL